MEKPKMKFIRKNGRIIPIKDKNHKNKNEKSNNESRGKIMKDLASRDRDLAKTGNVVAGVSAVASFGLAGLAIKKKSGAAGALAAMAGLFSITNKAFADGREYSAKDADKYAKDLSAGKKIKKGSGIGGASSRQYENAKALQEMGSRKLDYFEKTMNLKKKKK